MEVQLSPVQSTKDTKGHKSMTDRPNSRFQKYVAVR